MKKPKVGIVGGSGYIGYAVAKSLSERFAVKVIDKNPPKNPAYQQDSVEFQQCDILEYEDIKQALKDVELVIHTAIVQIPQINEQRKLGYQVNFLGIQNVCKVVDEIPSIKGMVFSGTWHVFGERDLNGTIDEAFGFRPDKVEERARLYALSKIAQEVIVRYFDEMSTKTYGLIRMATVLGEGMPEKTAANIFISKGLKGEPITPFKHSMHRPMLYVDVNDVCRAYCAYATKILSGEIRKEENSLAHVVNLCWPKPITIVELAYMVRDTIIKLTNGKIKPQVEILDSGQPILFEEADKEKLKVDISKVHRLLGIKQLKNPQESIEEITRNAIQKLETS